jgi:hypothetical protein
VLGVRFGDEGGCEGVRFVPESGGWRDEELVTEAVETLQLS